MNNLNELLKYLQKKDKTKEIIKLWRKGRIKVYIPSNYPKTEMSTSINWVNTESQTDARRI